MGIMGKISGYKICKTSELAGVFCFVLGAKGLQHYVENKFFFSSGVPH